MYPLLRMDFIACRIYLLIGFAAYLLYVISSYQGALGFFVLNIGATIVLAMASILIHDKYRTEQLVCFLPPSRRQVVVARYLIGFLALLAGLGLQYIGGAALANWFRTSGFSTLCTPQAVLVFCLVPLVVISLYYPCYFKFGMGYGLFAFLILAVVLTVILTSPMLVAIWTGNDTFVITEEMARQPERILVALVDHVATPLGKWPFFAATVTGAMVVAASSLLVSIKLFQRRDF